jgi:RND family efflux transporter MFP subunit
MSVMDTDVLACKGRVMKKFIIVIILLAMAGLIGWQVYEKTRAAESANQGRRGPLTIAVETKPVSRQTIRRLTEFGGSLTPQSEYTVAPKVPGRLEQLLVHIGDTVRHGELVAILDGEEYVQQVKQVEAELEVAKANLAEADSALEVARRDFERKDSLRKKQATSVADYDESSAKFQAAVAKRNVALAQITQKEAGLRAAEVRLSYTKIYASWEGGGAGRWVSERYVDEGAMLRANDPIVTVVDIESVVAVIHAIERDYPQIKVGQNAVIRTDAYPERSFAGTIVRISPILKESSRQARVEIKVPNQEGLLAPGMFIRAAIQFEERPDALTVPRTALVRRDGLEGVFVADLNDNTARFVPITPGIVDNGRVEVIEPELTGEVVTLGHHLLVDGTAIMRSGEPGPSGNQTGGKKGSGKKPESASPPAPTGKPAPPGDRS